jgi:hypothetical protein
MLLIILGADGKYGGIFVLSSKYTAFTVVPNE